jgi:hypothetical protein
MFDEESMARYVTYNLDCYCQENNKFNYNIINFSKNQQLGIRHLASIDCYKPS